MKKKTLKIEFKNHEVEIPYLIFEGKKGKGPHLFLSGGMHGDEINGVIVIKEFLKWAKSVDLEKKLSGKITVLPVLNPSGFSVVMREVFEDSVDLNRSFGQKTAKTFSEKIAHELMDKILKKCDLGLDFHDAGQRSVLLPHTRVHKRENSGVTKEMGRLFGTDIIIGREGDSGMMAVALYKKYKIPVLTVETGGAQVVFPKFVKVAIQGIRNILAQQKMYPSKIIIPEKQYYLYDRFGISFAYPVEISFEKKLGDFVHYKDKIGEVYNPLNQKVEPILAPMCGIIFSLWQTNQVPVNEVVYSILETVECHVKRTTLNKFEKMGSFDVKQVEM